MKLYSPNLFRVLAVIWSFVLVGLSLTPGKELPVLPVWNADKYMHAGFYAIWSFLIFMIRFSKPGKRMSKRYAMLSFWSLISIGWTIEFIQGTWIPDRYFDYMDGLANMIGVASVPVVWRIFRMFKRYSLKRLRR